MEDMKFFFWHLFLSMVKVNHMAILKVCILSGRIGTKNQGHIEKSR